MQPDGDLNIMEGKSVPEMAASLLAQDGLHRIFPEFRFPPGGLDSIPGFLPPITDSKSVSPSGVNLQRELCEMGQRNDFGSGESVSETHSKAPRHDHTNKEVFISITKHGKESDICRAEVKTEPPCVPLSPTSTSQRSPYEHVSSPVQSMTSFNTVTSSPMSNVASVTSSITTSSASSTAAVYSAALSRNPICSSPSLTSSCDFRNSQLEPGEICSRSRSKDSMQTNPLRHTVPSRAHINHKETLDCSMYSQSHAGLNDSCTVQDLSNRPAIHSQGTSEIHAVTQHSNITTHHNDNIPLKSPMTPHRSTGPISSHTGTLTDEMEEFQVYSSRGVSDMDNYDSVSKNTTSIKPSACRTLQSEDVDIPMTSHRTSHMHHIRGNSPNMVNYRDSHDISLDTRASSNLDAYSNTQEISLDMSCNISHNISQKSRETLHNSHDISHVSHNLPSHESSISPGTHSIDNTRRNTNLAHLNHHVPYSRHESSNSLTYHASSNSQAYLNATVNSSIPAPSSPVSAYTSPIVSHQPPSSPLSYQSPSTPNQNHSTNHHHSISMYSSPPTPGSHHTPAVRIPHHNSNTSISSYHNQSSSYHATSTPLSYHSPVTPLNIDIHGGMNGHSSGDISGSVDDVSRLNEITSPLSSPRPHIHSAFQPHPDLHDYRGPRHSTMAYPYLSSHELLGMPSQSVDLSSPVASQPGMTSRDLLMTSQHMSPFTPHSLSFMYRQSSMAANMHTIPSTAYQHILDRDFKYS